MSESHRKMLENYGTLAARIVIGVFFIIAGLGKVGSGFGLGAGFDGTVGYAASAGLPMPELLVLLSTILEVGGGLGVLLGFHMGLAAAALAFVSIFTAVFFHPPSDPMQRVIFFKNISIAGGLIYMMVYGPGTGFSMDKKSLNN